MADFTKGLRQKKIEATQQECREACQARSRLSEEVSVDGVGEEGSEDGVGDGKGSVRERPIPRTPW